MGKLNTWTGETLSVWRRITHLIAWCHAPVDWAVCGICFCIVPAGELFIKHNKLHNSL